MSKKNSKTEPTMQQSNSVKNTTVNAYFRFILYDVPLLNTIIVQINNMLNNTNYDRITIIKGAFLIDTDDDMVDISGKKAASLIVYFKDISILEYYKLMYMIQDKSDKIFDASNDSVIVSIDTDCSNDESKFSRLDMHCIYLNHINYLIRRHSEHSLLLNNYEKIYALSSKAKTKISVYAINSNKINEDSNNTNTNTGDELNDIFDRYDYLIDRQPLVAKNTDIVSFYPNDLNNSLSDILLYEFEYDGDHILYEECLSELVSFAKDNVYIIGIVLSNELNVHRLVYRSNSEFQFNIEPLTIVTSTHE